LNVFTYTASYILEIRNLQKFGRIARPLATPIARPEKRVLISDGGAIGEAIGIPSPILLKRLILWVVPV
jgi:hypothetical protein